MSLFNAYRNQYNKEFARLSLIAVHNLFLNRYGPGSPTSGCLFKADMQSYDIAVLSVSLADVLSAVKGHVPMLLRHPCGAAVIDEIYNMVSASQRNHLAAEFYGKEFTLLSQVRHLQDSPSIESSTEEPGQSCQQRL